MLLNNYYIYIVIIIYCFYKINELSLMEDVDVRREKTVYFVVIGIALGGLYYVHYQKSVYDWVPNIDLDKMLNESSNDTTQLNTKALTSMRKKYRNTRNKLR